MRSVYGTNYTDPVLTIKLMHTDSYKTNTLLGSNFVGTT